MYRVYRVIGVAQYLHGQYMRTVSKLDQLLFHIEIFHLVQTIYAQAAFLFPFALYPFTCVQLYCDYRMQVGAVFSEMI
jgi:hypothetical protein